MYSSSLGTGDQKQSATISELIRVLGDTDLIHTEGDVLGNAYEYLIGQFASETGKKAGEFYTPHGPDQILCRIAISGQEDKKGLQVYESKVQSMIQFNYTLVSDTILSGMSITVCRGASKLCHIRNAHKTIKDANQTLLDMFGELTFAAPDIEAEVEQLAGIFKEV